MGAHVDHLLPGAVALAAVEALVDLDGIIGRVLGGGDLIARLVQTCSAPPSSPFRSAVVPRGPVTRANAPPTKPRERKKKTKPDAALPPVLDPEGTSPKRGRASEHAAPNGPRTSLGDGVGKPAGARIAWTQLLRRISWVDVLACPCGGRRALVGDLCEHATSSWPSSRAPRAAHGGPAERASPEPGLRRRGIPRARGCFSLVPP